MVVFWIVIFEHLIDYLAQNPNFTSKNNEESFFFEKSNEVSKVMFSKSPVMPVLFWIQNLCRRVEKRFFCFKSGGNKQTSFSSTKSCNSYLWTLSEDLLSTCWLLFPFPPPTFLGKREYYILPFRCFYESLI